MAAVLVAYHPDAQPEPVLKCLIEQVSQVVLVDNSLRGLPQVAAWRGHDRVHIIHQGNVGGLAGAYNAALAYIRREHPTIAHVVFVDEDSDPAVLSQFLGDLEVRQLLCDSVTAAVAPAHRDRATGMRAKHIQLTRLRVRYLPREFEGVRQVSFLINSMSVWRMDAIATIGGFDEALAVDHIDTEYCLRARARGLRLYIHGDYEFVHSIGQRRAYRLFGLRMQSGGHGAERRYMIGRNTASLMRSYLFREPAFAVLCMLRLAYEAIGILVAEDQRSIKLARLLAGAVQGAARTAPRRP